MFGRRLNFFNTTQTEIEFDFKDLEDAETTNETLFKEESTNATEVNASNELEIVETSGEENLDNLILSQLQEKLEVKETTLTDFRKIEEFWDGISFKFSKTEDPGVDSYQHRVRFNSVEIANSSAVKPEVLGNVRQEKIQKHASEAYYEKTVLEVKAASPNRDLSVLKNICDDFLTSETTKFEENIQEMGKVPVQSFISQEIKEEKDFDNLGKSSATSEKITKAMLRNFFQSLSEEELEFPEQSTSANKHLLSESAKKIRQTRAEGFENFNKILTGIVKADSVKKISPQSFNEDAKENVQANQQLQENPLKRVLFKDQVPSTSKSIQQKPDSFLAKNQPRLMSNRTYDKLEKLNDRFKIGGAKKTEKPESSNSSIFNTSMSDSKKLQLKSTINKSKVKEVANSSQDLKLKESYKNDINKYLNEFCREKFTD